MAFIYECACAPTAFDAPLKIRPIRMTGIATSSAPTIRGGWASATINPHTMANRTYPMVIRHLHGAFASDIATATISAELSLTKNIGE